MLIAQNSKSIKQELTASALLSKGNTVLLLVDHQIGLLSGVRDFTTAGLTHNIVALAKAAKILGVPIIVTAVGSEGLWGLTIPKLLAALPDVTVIKRTTIRSLATLISYPFSQASHSLKPIWAKARLVNNDDLDVKAVR